MLRTNLPELDLLDSPLVSPTPLTSVGGVPGSAIAEKIFNDPDSWDKLLDQDLEGCSSETMAWFAEEVEKFRELSMTSDEREAVTAMEQSDLILRPFSAHYKVMPVTGPVSSIHDTAPSYTGMQQDEPETAVLSSIIELEQQKIGRTGDSHDSLIKIWESGGNLFRSIPSPLVFSPPSSSSDDFVNSMDSHASSLVLTGSTSPSVSITSPLAVASTTWSFLEWHGIHLESPRQAIQSATVRVRKSRARGILQTPSLPLHVLAEPPTSPPKVPLPRIPITAQTMSTPDKPPISVRRLPLVPLSETPSRTASFSSDLIQTASHTASPVLQVSQAESAMTPAFGCPSSLPARLSVRSPPPVGPRPKGLSPPRGQSPSGGKGHSRSLSRPLALRPPLLNL
ncbi:hypothetical protein AMATHDRAFT_5126 [Amanita thiersii Skay4041]|uniref:Uncharacterized protein n=1 Tax=Amanita thiersii Skay4041 TaxID=703135 RepID=A0A2A9NIJ6_9AGAR|nr:hypothetical protein AMATHDRAFT_5126 [Amanita thiersii Skay4041]